jgi:hypothetical protein
MEEADGPWTLPVDLATLHNVIIAYGVHIQTEAEAKHFKTGNGPLSYLAISNLHRTAIVNHRAVRALCEMGWTPTTPTMIRTLLDILVSVYAIGTNPENAEYMGFKYLGTSVINVLKDPDTPVEAVKSNTNELEKLKKELQPADVQRVDDLIASYKKPPPYWYSPEISSPGNAIRQNMATLLDVWKAFCGSTHGSFMESLIFSDSPDEPGIDPEENPLKTRNAILASSRLLLDISFARGQFEGVADLPEYKDIVKTYILPQKALV